MHRFEGKVCIVTGSGGSIGRASAVRLAAEGGKIVGCDVIAESAEETVALVVEAGGEMISVHPCNLTNREDCERLVAVAVQRFGRIDVLFNNAAMAYFGFIDTITDDAWYKTINEELNLVFLLSRAAWSEIVKSKGTIVNTASIAAHIALPDLPSLAHSSAKAGVLAFTRHLAMEGRKHSVRVNSVSPGTIETNQTRPLMQDPVFAEKVLSRYMMNRLGQPEEVASAVAFLASDDASFITGTDLHVDGGVTSW